MSTPTVSTMAKSPAFRDIGSTSILQDTEVAGIIVIDPLAQMRLELGKDVVCMNPSESKHVPGMYFRTIRCKKGAMIGTLDNGMVEISSGSRRTVEIFLGSVCLQFDAVNKKSVYSREFEGALVFSHPSDVVKPAGNRARVGFEMIQQLVEQVTEETVAMDLVRKGGESVNFIPKDEHLDQLKLRAKLKMKDGKLVNASILNSSGVKIIGPGEAVTPEFLATCVRGAYFKVTVGVDTNWVNAKTGKQGVTVEVHQMVAIPDSRSLPPPWQSVGSDVPGADKIPDFFSRNVMRPVVRPGNDPVRGGKDSKPMKILKPVLTRQTSTGHGIVEGSGKAGTSVSPIESPDSAFETPKMRGKRKAKGKGKGKRNLAELMEESDEEFTVGDTVSPGGTTITKSK